MTDPAQADRRQALLTLEQVRSGYGPNDVLRGISLEVREGEIVTLLGANGAGKSTTLNTICGLVSLRSGRIRLGSSSIGGHSTTSIVRQGVVQVPEGRKLFSELTVRENLEMGAYLRKDRAAVPADIDRVFQLFPRLAERPNQLAGSLSGGEQQMCAIGRGLMARPRLMLLDEPSLGLAPILCEQIFETIERLNREGTTIFLVEQNANAALRLAQRGYIMETGKITISGSTAELRDDPRVQEAYLGA